MNKIFNQKPVSNLSTETKNIILKIFKKIALLIFPLYIVWFLYVKYLPIFFNEANNSHWVSIKQTSENQVKIPYPEILFLGESRVNAGVDFTQISNCYSYAAGGSTPIEMYYVLKKYLKTHAKPKKIFVSISPRFLSEIFAFFPNAVQNDFFTFSEIEEIARVKSRFEQDTLFGKYFWGRCLLYQLKYPGFYQPEVSRSYGFTAYSDNKKMNLRIAELHGGRDHPGLKATSSALNYETKYQNFKPSPILDFYLNLIFRTCRMKKIDLIFDFMPVNESSYRNLKSEFVQNYRSYISKYAGRYPEFQISDTVYFYPDSLFGDESHLNFKGKEKFTKYLKTKYFRND